MLILHSLKRLGNLIWIWLGKFNLINIFKWFFIFMLWPFRWNKHFIAVNIITVVLGDFVYVNQGHFVKWVSFGCSLVFYSLLLHFIIQLYFLCSFNLERRLTLFENVSYIYLLPFCLSVWVFEGGFYSSLIVMGV